MKKVKGVMRFEFKVLPEWPALSWVAECSNHESVIIVYCGSKVETGNDQWFCEAVWVGEYAAGDFDQTDIVAGSGARIRDDKVMFVSPGSTVDRLQFLQHDDCIRISNSLCALLVMAEGSVDSTYYYHQRDMGSIILGLHQYKKTISTTAGPVRLVYLHNIEWDGLELRIVEKPGGVRDFSTFAKYYDFLDFSMKKLAKNSADNGRKHSLKLLCPLSNGYDSPTVAVLAKRAGCQEAITFDAGRSGVDDSGHSIGQQLGIETRVLVRDAWKAKNLDDIPYPEVPFIAGSGANGEVLLLGAHDYLSGTVLLTGFQGDAVWGKSHHDLSDKLVRVDGSGLCFTEYRLLAGFIHCAVPFWGARQIRDLCKLSNSSELQPWDIGGSYSRPICRRIVEEAGVLREQFGQSKCGISVPPPHPGNFLLPKSERDYFRWFKKHQIDWKKRGRIPPNETLSKLLDTILAPAANIFLGLSKIRVLRRSGPYVRFMLDIASYLSSPLYIRRYTFPWAVDKAMERYRRPEEGVRCSFSGE